MTVTQRIYLLLLKWKEENAKWLVNSIVEWKMKWRRAKKKKRKDKMYLQYSIVCVYSFTFCISKCVHGNFEGHFNSIQYLNRLELEHRIHVWIGSMVVHTSRCIGILQKSIPFHSIRFIFIECERQQTEWTTIGWTNVGYECWRRRPLWWGSCTTCYSGDVSLFVIVNLTWFLNRSDVTVTLDTDVIRNSDWKCGWIDFLHRMEFTGSIVKSKSGNEVANAYSDSFQLRFDQATKRQQRRRRRR